MLTEDFYANVAMVRDLQLWEDEDVHDALQADAAEGGLSVDIEDGNNIEVWGTDINPYDFEDTQLSIRTERGLGYYASY